MRLNREGRKLSPFPLLLFFNGTAFSNGRSELNRHLPSDNVYVFPLVFLSYIWSMKVKNGKRSISPFLLKVKEYKSNSNFMLLILTWERRVKDFLNNVKQIPDHVMIYPSSFPLSSYLEAP